MNYGDQLHKARELVGERDLVKEVTVVWLQQTGEEPIEFGFVEEPYDDSPNESDDPESLYDLFIVIGESFPRKVWLKFSDGTQAEIFDQDVDGYK